MSDIFERHGAKPATEGGRKLGTGHAAAMFRLGLKELRNAVNPSRESVADSEIGLYGTQTQGEIAEARGSVHGGAGLDAHQEKPRPKEPEAERGR